MTTTNRTPWTPGPWKASTYINYGLVDRWYVAPENAQGWLTGSIADMSAVIQHTPHGGTPEANAHLIALAPEMAEALQVALSWIGRTPRKDDMPEYAKARGAVLSILSRLPKGE